MPTDRQREVNRAASARYRAAHPERRKAICKAYRESETGSVNSRERVWAKRLGRLYGMTQEIYERMFREQDGKCYLCNQPEKMVDASGDPIQLCVDHSHQTGKVRRLLCHGCNFAVGRVESNPMLYEKIGVYIHQFEG